MRRDDVDESTPPVNSFGAARTTARELTGIKRTLADVHRLVWIELLLLAFIVGGVVALSVVVGKLYFRLR